MTEARENVADELLKLVEKKVIQTVKKDKKIVCSRKLLRIMTNAL